MIIKLNSDTPQLALRIVEPGCNGRQLQDVRIQLVIEPADCPRPEQLEPYWEDCRLKWRSMRPAVPAITYEAFEIDEDGMVVFYFDDLLWSRPAGRYHAKVMLGDICNQTHFDIELNTVRATIDRAVVKSAPPCTDDCGL